MDLGLGASIGIDLVRRIGLNRGVTAANGFINLRAIYSRFQYSQLPLLVSIGGGIGGQGIRYIFSKGDPNYPSGAEDKSNGVIVLAQNLFAEVEFPVSEQYRFHGMLRYVHPSRKSHSLGIPVKIDTEISEPKGKIGGYYFVIGLKYTWR